MSFDYKMYMKKYNQEHRRQKVEWMRRKRAGLATSSRWGGGKAWRKVVLMFLGVV